MKSLITVSTNPWPGVDWVVPPMIKASVNRCSGADTEPGTITPDASRATPSTPVSRLSQRFTDRSRSLMVTQITGVGRSLFYKKRNITPFTGPRGSYEGALDLVAAADRIVAQLVGRQGVRHARARLDPGPGLPELWRRTGRDVQAVDDAPHRGAPGRAFDDVGIAVLNQLLGPLRHRVANGPVDRALWHREIGARRHRRAVCDGEPR